ncbi:hypothetical protein Gogos_003241, partial [Gossypium gossypioides]|nr:hypothetical protein [Gossypium gossypioides]
MTRELATEALENGDRNYNGPKVAKFLIGIDFGLFLRSLGGGRRRPPSRGLEPSVRYHSRIARILTLCQNLQANEKSQGISL